MWSLPKSYGQLGGAKMILKIVNIKLILYHKTFKTKSKIVQANRLDMTSNTRALNSLVV